MLHRSVVLGSLALTIIAAAFVWKFSSHGSEQLKAIAAGACGVSGKITSTAGAGVADARVCALQISLASGAATCARSGADGTYQLEKLAAKDYRISASASGFGSGEYAEAVRVHECGVESKIDIMLSAQGVELAGRVRDGLGVPVKDAQLKVVGQGAAFKFGVAVQSDAKGAFSAIVPPGSMRMEVTARGYAKAQVFAVAPNSLVEIVLIPGATLSGRVVSKADGQTVAGVNVRAVPEGMITHEYAPSAPSDRSGHFSIEGLSPGIYRLEAVDVHWRGQGREALDVALGDRVENLVVEVAAGVQVKGRVLTSESRTPCKLGNVVLFPNGGEKDEGAFYGSLIDTDGDVAFDGVPPGRYGVGVSCMDHRPPGSSAPNIEVADQDIAGLEWTVDPASRVLISVEDQIGRPMDGVNVGLLDERNVFMPGLGQGNGKYSLSPVPQGRYQVIAANRAMSGDAKPGVPIVVGEDARSLEVKLVLRGSAQIEVTARNDDGSPRGRLHVYAMPSESSTPLATVRATELGNGLYRVAPLSAGSYRVIVADGQNPPFAQQIALAEGESRKLDLQVQLHGSIDGRVVDGNGKPIPGVVISARSKNGTGILFREPAMGNDQLRDGAVMTDANGDFSLSGLAEDSRYEVLAQKAMSVAVRQGDVMPGTHLSLAMESTRSVSGVALDENGRPADRFSVSAFNKDAGVGRSGVKTNTGEWRIEGIVPGHVIVSAEDATTGRQAEQEVVVEPGRDLGNVRLVLRQDRSAAQTPNN